MELQWPQIAKEILKKKIKAEGITWFWSQAILQSCRPEDNIVLVQNQTHPSMERNRKPRHGPTTIWSTNLGKSKNQNLVEKRQSLQQMVLGTVDYNRHKNETGPLFLDHTQKYIQNGLCISVFINGELSFWN